MTIRPTVVPAAALLCALLLPGSGLAQRDLDGTLRSMGRQLAVVEDAIRAVEQMADQADHEKDSGWLGCLEDRLMYLEGLNIAGRSAMDQFAVAQLQQDRETMDEAVSRLSIVAARAPRYLAEARSCTDKDWRAMTTRCQDRRIRAGYACTEWRVASAFDAPEIEFGYDRGGSTRPPDASPIR